ncbi:MAG: hydantoinase/oxoprolinase family protein [Desulfurococcaceae archaeon]
MLELYVVGIDVGGTFTDIIYVKPDGSLGYLKVLSTPRSPEVAIVNSLKFMGLQDFLVIHATTIATNTLRGQIGLELPKTALITTRGFRDVIEIARQNRPKLYDPFFEKPPSLVPRELRFEVDERVDYTGKVLKSLDPSKLKEVGTKLKELGVESTAIVFLHSYVNPVHEELAERILSGYVKYVTASYKISPEPREYERTSTTVVNAVLKPIISKYIERLWSSLKYLGARELYIMSSSGGLVDVNEARERPVQLVESGPAAGVVASAEFAKVLGISNVISFDMGGTTAKAGTIVNLEIEITSEYEVGGESHHGRVVKGSGYTVRYPFIDLSEVSAGGGTIIWRDEAGALRVGPISAGADPGPACYGRGGSEPTVTDANLILGRVSEILAGGAIRLNKEAAVRAFSKLGDPLEVATEAVELVNLEMARGIRLVTVERGVDPEGFTLVAFGGAGPQHAAFIAAELGIKHVIIPPHPGLFSALGLLLADWKFEASASYPRNIEEAYSHLESMLLEKLNGKVDYFVRYADVRYAGQGWELTVPVKKPSLLEDIKKTFEEKHLTAFGFKLDEDVEVVVIRIFAIRVNRFKPALTTLRADITEAKPIAYRKVFFEDWVETPVYARNQLPAWFVAEGPAVIDEYSSCTIVPPGWRFQVGGLGELRLER